MTVPAGTVSDHFSMEVPKPRWSSASASWAWSSVMPLSWGTSYRSLPRESTIVTVPPPSTREPGSGSVPTTRPAGTVSE